MTAPYMLMDRGDVMNRKRMHQRDSGEMTGTCQMLLPGFLLCLMLAAFFSGDGTAAPAKKKTPADRPGKAVYREWTVTWGGGSARVLNAKTGQTLILFRKYSTEGMKDKAGFWTSADYRLLSVVGPFVSFREDWSAVIGGRTSKGTRYVTVDIRQGRDVSLTALYDEKTLLKALLKNRVVATELGKRKVNSLKELFRSPRRSCGPFLNSIILSSFAFHHVKRNSVGVRLCVFEGCEVMRGASRQLDITLPLPKLYKTDFKNAVKGRMLMGDLYAESR